MDSEVHRVQVEKLVAGGEGLARLKDGRVVFVPAVIAGETIDIQLVEKKTDFARAILTGVVEPSSFRRPAPCPEVVRGCGGCDWQHMQRERQSSSKADIVKEAFLRTAKLVVDIPEAITLPDSARPTVPSVSPVRPTPREPPLLPMRSPQTRYRSYVQHVLVADQSPSCKYRS